MNKKLIKLSLAGLALSLGGAYMLGRNAAADTGVPNTSVVETINRGMRAVVGDDVVDSAESMGQGFFCRLFGGCRVEDYGFVFCDEFGFCYEVSAEQGQMLLSQNPGGRLKTVLKSDIPNLTANNSQS